MKVNTTCSGLTRPVLDWSNLTRKEQAQWSSYADRVRLETGDFARYRGKCYFLHDMHVIPDTDAHGDPHPLHGKWDAQKGLDHKCGVMMRYTADKSACVFGSYYVVQGK